MKMGRRSVKNLPWLVASVCLLVVAPARAEEAPTVLGDAPESAQSRGFPDIKVYRYTNRSGVRSYSDKPPAGVRYQIMKFDCFACNPTSTVDWTSIPLQLQAYKSSIEAAARQYRVDPALVRAVIHAESAFQPKAKSSKGALGLMQLMPGTARDMGVQNALLVPDDNIPRRCEVSGHAAR